MHLLRGHAGEHTGYVLDGALDEAFMTALDDVRTSLPIDKEKKKTAAARRFLCTAESDDDNDNDNDNDNDFQWIRPHLVHAITQSLSSNEFNEENQHENQNEQPPLKEVRVLPYMRFLEYSTPNGSLGPHTDALIRCKETEVWSTHTLLVFCTDVDVGGETALLPEDPKSTRMRERNADKARVAAEKLRSAIARVTADDTRSGTTTEDCAEDKNDNGDDDDGTTSSITARLHRLQTALVSIERRTLMPPLKPSFAVKPQRGRIFFFPHECPHEGRPTVSVPKIFLRAELILKWGST
eukprot:CAMPEP_0201631478 /NCGR_PEP_ID=MMETSP0493-20130528/5444_1 /ASSEMBLY_ACC=CAM_ASM_000838 /TAXON_ID=420259 /ORGANISM="Thalassiosira gravida, Strain GMp14c1" /LENGTH=295 /DNA_ID=CAMNT_0048102825 /DNA_START=35 /DNA_END=922 /DNA_ORIENTATION=+